MGFKAPYKIMLEISDKTHEHVNNAILISGSARSGTTVLGKIIHSLEGVEYVYEPPVLYGLFPLINDLPADQWQMLYETYLYEEHFMNAIAGRSINCNTSDDSSIYRVKSKSDIQERLAVSTSKKQAEKLAKAKTIAYKMPDIVAYIPALQKYYPNTRVVIINRNATETINSLHQKKWFTNENARKNLLWPFTTYNGIQIPFWVQKNDHQEWYEMNTIDRCAYYYLHIMRSTKIISNKIEVEYADLVQKPQEIISTLAQTLGLKFGAKTQDILATVAPTHSPRNENILDQVRSSFKDEILTLKG
jgi:hypothetical protein